MAVFFLAGSLASYFKCVALFAFLTTHCINDADGDARRLRGNARGWNSDRSESDGSNCCWCSMNSRSSKTNNNWKTKAVMGVGVRDAGAGRKQQRAGSNGTARCRPTGAAGNRKSPVSIAHIHPALHAVNMPDAAGARPSGPAGANAADFFRYHQHFTRSDHGKPVRHGQRFQMPRIQSLPL